LKEIDLSRMK